MWIKLTTEYVNLAHILRVRTSRSFRNGQDESVVELEGVVKGELQFFTRYRGIDADIVLNALNLCCKEEPAVAFVQSQANVGTLHDVTI